MSERRGRVGLVGAIGALAAAALLLGLTSADAALPLVGLLLVLAALLEIGHGFRRASAAARRAAWLDGAVSILIGVLLMNAASLAGHALVLGLAGWFAADGVRCALAARRAARAGGRARGLVLSALGDGVVATLLLAFAGRAAGTVALAAGALRIAGTAWSIVTAATYTVGDAGRTVAQDLELPDDPEVQRLADRLAAEEQARAPIDRGWIGGLVIVLFAIHLGRMGLDRSGLGVLSPAVAVAGDLALALAVAFGVVVPARLAWRRATRGVERRAWGWCRGTGGGRAVRWGRRATRVLLERRLRFSVRLRSARYALGAAVSRGLQIGLPVAAVVAATVPIFGMNWFFDTENWAAGLWNAWAEARTDTWRRAMVVAVFERERAAGRARPFAVTPPGVDGDFAFLVVGDPGEGDASQHVLRDRLLDAARGDDVRFVVVSSDVVYPTGAMRDYEAKFWLPLKGATRPVYAIPGNHDWYDALEAFAATFMEPDAARAAMRARVAADGHVTSTTDRRIEALIAEAARLRGEYAVPTGFQRAPFFQVQTDRFVLVAVDTGVGRRIDDVQRLWLESVLAGSRGKLVMAVLGHPFYAGGHYQAAGREDFATIHGLLRRHDVAIVMGGDTHDLEYYREEVPDQTPPRTVHHFVNGGGGAYLSFGTALAWPARPATGAWAYYPGPAAVVAKIEATLPAWKRPLWWWTRRFQAWPFSAEWLSAAFDSNVAPFYQSFVEVRVEPSAGRVRIRPIGVHGRLRWADLETSAALRPVGAAPDDPVEWTIGMTGADGAR